MSTMSPNAQDVSRLIAGMTPEERERTLRDLLMQRQTAGGDDVRKIEDANLLLRLRPKVKVTTFIPLTRRFAERLQDRKVWDLGIIDPLADEDIPGRPQIVRVEVWPPPEEGPSVLFERDTVLGMPGAAQTVRLDIPAPEARRMQRPASADLDEGSVAGVPPTPPPTPPPTLAGVPLPTVSPDDFEDGPGVEQGPTTVPVDPTVLLQLQERLERLEALEAENRDLRERLEKVAPAQEPDSPGGKAAARRRGKPVREPTPGARDKEAAEAPTPEPVGS